MNTAILKKFAQAARRQLMEQVASRLDYVLNSDSAEIRGKEKAVAELEEQIKTASREAVIDRVAYTWFNRFCALRFMDVNRYTRMGAVSPAQGFTQPEILQEAKQGHIDEQLDKFIDKQFVFDLLSGRVHSKDAQQEAYRLLLVAVCNYYYSLMPFMFEKIADYTELLMPDDLLSPGSLPVAVCQALTPEACRDVEVIGWLYQFYISEKKDEVIAGLKSNLKITPANIPAATQLFTPHWIVRYLVENSLGRLWLLNRPQSRLKEKMDYYIEPEQEESGFLRLSSPEEIRICDPACGSGHMLVYAFELLYTIYEEEGYDAPGIPGLILKHNLYGIEIDERAGELAAFALFMKAREKYRRFFSKPVQPHICVLQNVRFESGELKGYIDEMGSTLFTLNLQTTLLQFEEVDNVGSLIRPELTNVPDVYRVLEEKKMGDKLFLQNVHKRVLTVLKQAGYLGAKYHIVIANPPYMGNKGMNDELKKFARDNYPDSKSDLFAMFIERNLDLAIPNGTIAMITMQSWMFISAYEKFRYYLFSKSKIMNSIHLGAHAFNTISGHVVQTIAFVLSKGKKGVTASIFVDLTHGRSESEKEEELMNKENYHRCTIDDLSVIPSWPLSYKISPATLSLFGSGSNIGKITFSSSANVTGDNDRFLRYFWEVNSNDVTMQKPYNWLQCAKGGDMRKWAGNIDMVIDWSPETHVYYRSTKVCRYVNEEHWGKDGITWSRIASSKNVAFRHLPCTATFETAGMTIFPINGDSVSKSILLGYLNSCVSRMVLRLLNPTLTLQMREVLAVPYRNIDSDEQVYKIKQNVNVLSGVASDDWDGYERSWDFKELPLLREEFRKDTLEETYYALRDHWQQMTAEMQRLEEENNRIFIEAYGLQDELSPHVPLEEITLTCNPHYRFGKNKNEEELEALLLADTMREFISYAVGCMFGRYAIDKPGLILANQGETANDYREHIPESTFPPDEDNVIPILDGDWFSDDMAGRFFNFLRITFGETHYRENLAFIETAIGKDIRGYFLKDFYNHHIKGYKKRPIYWLFSSPKGSFNALIYMHRYRPHTVSVVLNDYLREFRAKLTARKEHLETITISESLSQVEKTRAVKEIENYTKIIAELEIWEREVLYPLAARQLSIALDDGVKVNYPKFGPALKKVPGLS